MTTVSYNKNGKTSDYTMPTHLFFPNFDSSTNANPKLLYTSLV